MQGDNKWLQSVLNPRSAGMRVLTCTHGYMCINVAYSERSMWTEQNSRMQQKRPYGAVKRPHTSHEQLVRGTKKQTPPFRGHPSSRHGSTSRLVTPVPHMTYRPTYGQLQHTCGELQSVPFSAISEVKSSFMWSLRGKPAPGTSSRPNEEIIWGRLLIIQKH